MSKASRLVSVRNGYETDYFSDDYGIDCSQDDRTKQSFRDECDVNNIVNRWLKSGLMPSANILPPQYLDVSNVPDYQTSLNLVNEANAMFAALPAAVRDRFDNNPAKLLAFVQDKSNLDEAIQLGLCERREPSTGATERSQAAGDVAPVGGSHAPANAPSGGV